MPIHATRLKSQSTVWRGCLETVTATATSSMSKHKVPNVIFTNSLNCVSVKNNNLDKHCDGVAATSMGVVSLQFVQHTRTGRNTLAHTHTHSRTRGLGRVELDMGGSASTVDTEIILI